MVYKGMKKLLIISDRTHPHFGEVGEWDKSNHINQTGQFFFQLDNCSHGKDGCYALPNQVTPVEEKRG